MKKIILDNRVYEVNCCLDCGKNSIEYSKYKNVLNNEMWICTECGTSYYINNKEIVIRYEDIFN